MRQAALPTARTRERVHAEVPERTDVVVIGAGLGGLMTAARLARAGLAVTVFDAHYVAGGCATMFHRTTRRGTWQFDIGLHYIGDCGPGGRIPTLLAEVGVELEFARMDDDGFDTIVLPDLRFPIPADRDRYRQRLVEFFPREKRGIDRYVRLLEEVDHMATWMEQEHRGGVATSLQMLWQVASHGRLLARYQHATIAQVLDDCTDDPVLRAVLLGQSGDYGVSPRRASALMHLGLQNHYFRGAWYPVGGGQVIADALCEVIESHGGRVCLRKPIDRILVEGGRAVGVRVAPARQDPREVRADVVVSNADLKHTLGDLLPEEALPPRWSQRRRKLEMGGAIFLGFFGVEGDLRKLGMQARNYWCFDSVDVEGMYADVARGRLDPRCVYITSASLKDPATTGHTPEGTMGVEVMALAPGCPEAWGVSPDDVLTGRYRKDPTYLAHKQRVEERLVEHLDRRFPGVAARLVFRESATPVTHTRFTRASEGTGYGLAATPEQMLKNRPGYRGPVDGLYLAGANTRAGHGIVGALASGRKAARRILADRGRLSSPPGSGSSGPA
ncbi:MAG: NAD(P)/FAD-dependent oxidoreductase [Deltaproteobacteria bacterium]|nr:MAG: NAD(P)/FAD-dependent oxidoreductase [Deltaproteobacteria bacterium]